MKRRAVIWVWVVLAAVVCTGGLLALQHRSLERRVREAIVAYDVALIEALREFDASRLRDVALPREIGRVQNYITLLEATGTRLDAEFVGLEVIDVRSQDPTVTAVVVEDWRETERDAASGAVRSSVIERRQRIEYTLVSDNGTLKVYLSQVASEDAR